MRWRGERQSSNVEDRRGISGRHVAAGGGIIGLVILLFSIFTGQDLSGLLNLFTADQSTQSYAPPQDIDPKDDTVAQLVSVVLASTEDVWQDIIQENFNKNYPAPSLVLFTDQTQSACGTGTAEMGPFYCPADQKVYIDLAFCDELRTRFRAPGNFAIAYVVAHEVGHHIQNLLGISDQVQQMRSRLSEADYNKLSVKLELQADFLAGVWAYHANQMRNILEPGDLETALTAANSIGDDKLQMEARGYVVPDSFTHGTSKQRMYWFKRGFENGDLSMGKFEDIQ